MKQETAGAMLAATWGEITGSLAFASQREGPAPPIWSMAWPMPPLIAVR